MSVKKFKVGSIVYAVLDKRVYESYLYSIDLPIPEIFEQLNFPQFKIMVDLFSEAIDMISLNPKLKIANIIDLTPVALILLKNTTGINLNDINSFFSVWCKVVIETPGEGSEIRTVLSSRVFLTYEEAERYLNGTGVYCLLCKKEFKRKQDITPYLICDDCMKKIKENFLKFLSFFGPPNGVELTGYALRIKKNIPMTEGELKRIEEMNEKVDQGTWARKVLANGTIDYESIRLMTVSAAHDDSDYKRRDLVISAYKNYLNYLEGKFDPNSIALHGEGIEGQNSDKIIFEGLPSNLNLSDAVNNYTDGKIHCVLKLQDFKEHEIPYIESIKIILYVNSINQSEVVKVFSLTEARRRNNHGYFLFNDGLEFDINVSSFNIGNVIVAAHIDYNDEGTFEVISKIEKIPVTDTADDTFSNNVIVEDNSDYFSNKVITYNVKDTEDLKHIWVRARRTTNSSIENTRLKVNISNGKKIFNYFIDLTEFDQILKIKPLDIIMDMGEELTSFTRIVITYSLLGNGGYVGIGKKYYSIIEPIENTEMKQVSKLFMDYPSNKRFLIANESFNFKIKVQSEVTLHYYGFIFEFSKNQEVAHQEVVRYEDMENNGGLKFFTDELGMGSTIEIPVPFKQSMLRQIGIHNMSVYPIFKYDYQLSNESISTSANDVLSNKALDYFKVNNSLDVNLFNPKTGSADTVIRFFINNKQLLEKIDNCLIAIDPSMKGETLVKQSKKVKDIFERVISRSEDYYKTGKNSGIIKVERDEETETKNAYKDIPAYPGIKETIVLMASWVNIPEALEDKTFTDQFENGSITRKINDAIITELDGKFMLDLDSIFVLGKTVDYAEIDVDYDVRNLIEVDLPIGEDLWALIPVVEGSFIHLIYKCQLVSISFNNPLSGIPWNRVPLELMRDGIKAKILRTHIPSPLSPVPPLILPIEPLESDYVNGDKLFRTWKEAQDNMGWYICPLCGKIKPNTKDALTAQQLMKLSQEVIDKGEEYKDDKLTTLSEIANLDKQIEQLKKQSTRSYEWYKALNPKEYIEMYKEPKIRENSLYENVEAQERYGTEDGDEPIKSSLRTEERNDYNLNKEMNASVKNSLGVKYKKNPAKEERPDENIVLEEQKRNEERFKEKFDSSIDSKYNNSSLPGITDGIKKKIETANEKSSEIMANVKSKLNIDIFDQKPLLGEAVAYFKICPECQKKLIDAFKDILKWFQDLFDLDAEIDNIKYIQALFYKDTRDFSKYHFIKPTTEAEKEKIIAKINNALDELE